VTQYFVILSYKRYRQDHINIRILNWSIQIINITWITWNTYWLPFKFKVQLDYQWNS